jgi:hypothetical protein
MIPRVTVLQLDTHFPRIAGDVGAPESYARPPQIIRINGTSVGRIVTDRPQDIDITPFEAALAQATGDIIVTSCGFLSYWQAHLAAVAQRPFIASSLVSLDTLAKTFAPDELCILTFDAVRLGPTHLGARADYACSILGLRDDHHLRQVISGDLNRLNSSQAEDEICALLTAHQTAKHRHILLECTNLPPYRAAITAATGLPVTDILSCIEAACPGAIARDFS